MQNPYNIAFGEEPAQIISRITQTEQVIRSFSQDAPNSRIYMITGIRGSGKTVFLTTLSNYFRHQKDWIVEELNPERDLLQTFASKLYNNKIVSASFIKTKISLSAGGINTEIEQKEPSADIESVIIQMLEKIRNINKKVLITIDEAVNNQFMKIFANAFQIFIRRKLPVFILMTGLPENIDILQNSETLTFLYRAPKIYMFPLDMRTIAASYQNVFHFSGDEAREMSRITRGYPYAFQLLGYYTYVRNGDYLSAAEKCREYLYSNVYDRIWSELSGTDRNILFAMVETKSCAVQAIREAQKMTPNQFSPYRERLLKKGVVFSPERGALKFSLPFFRDYITDKLYYEFD